MRFCTLVLILNFFASVSAFAQTAVQTEAQPETQKTGEAAPGEKPKSDANASAYNYNVLLETKEERFNVGIFLQFSSFSRAGQTFTGNPFEVLAGYALTEKIGFNVNLMQALDMAAGGSVLYTGLRTSASYTFKGLNFSKRSTVMVNGAPSVSVMPLQEPSFQADFGFDQIFFNGTTRVAPATGMSVGVQYARTIGGYRWALMARYGSLTVSDDPVNLITAGAGLLYRF